MRRIQAYFRTEDEAVGAQTALLGYSTEGGEVSALTDPLGRERQILIPIVPFNTGNSGSGIGVSPATAGAVGGGAVVPGVLAGDTVDDDNRPADREDEPLTNDAVADGDLDDLHYTMELKVSEADYDAVVHALRQKHAYVEVFD
ncbi:hypothetical protein ACE6ED_17325 [Paenibacillus sp. CN-4]|uniref:hypothetical protein n=1 Tax=Paenibacillus nanchangensis TaxID=3348343 RepID=UPI00397BD5A2